MKVKLMYFKPNGKYYSSGEYITKKKMMHEVYEEVEDLWRRLRLPDLVDGAKYDHRKFSVLVEVPGHPYNVPHLFVDW